MPNDQPDWTSVVARPQTQLPGSPWVYGVGNNVRTFTLAADTSIIGILLPNFFNVAQLQVVGHTSGLTYLEADPTVQIWRQFYTVPIMSAVDASVDITIFAGTGATAYVVSIPDPIAAVALADNPAPWQAPNVMGTIVDFNNPGPGGIVTIIPGQTNARSIWLHSMFWIYSSTTSSSAGTWQDHAGNAVMTDSASFSNAPRYMDFKGSKLSAGNAFEYKQTGTAVAGSFTVHGAITYAVF